MEQIFLEHISRNINGIVNGNRWHGFSRGKSCLSNKIVFSATNLDWISGQRESDEYH